MKLPYKKLILASLLIPVLLFGKTVSAQTARTFTVVPPTIEANLNPGESTEGTMKVINDSDESLSFTTGVQDFTVNDTVGTPEILPPNTLSNKYSAASWIGITPQTFSVAPHQKQDLNYYIKLPSNARPGGHYAAVVYTPSSTGAVGGTGASVNTQVGSLFYISVKGNIKESASVVDFLAKKFQEYGPVGIYTQILNGGDLHIKPQGKVTIYDVFGRKVDSKPLELHNIFPGASRSFTNELGSKLMIGPYKAVFLGSYGVSNNLPLSATLSFFVFPWKIALIIVLIIIAAVLGFLYMKKRTKKSNDTPEPPKSSPEAPQGPTVIS